MKIKILENYIIREDGIIINKKTNKILKTTIREDGYLTVSLKLHNKWKQYRVHRLVAQSFIYNPDNKPEVNHKDGNKQNNHVNNLEWVTSKENKDHAWKNNLYSCYGENHNGSTLSEKEVHEICRLLELGYRNKDICNIFNISKDIISHIKCGDIWKHISNQYKIQVARKQRKKKEDIEQICILLKERKSVKEISSLFPNFGEENIRRIVRKETHTKISSNYF